MKLSLTIALMATCLFAMGQTNAPAKPPIPAPVKQFVPDWNRSLQIFTTASIAQWNDFIYVEQNGGQQAVLNSNIPSNTVQQLLFNHKAIADSIIAVFTRNIKAQQDRFKEQQK